MTPWPHLSPFFWRMPVGVHREPLYWGKKPHRSGEGKGPHCNGKGYLFSLAQTHNDPPRMMISPALSMS